MTTSEPPELPEPEVEYRRPALEGDGLYVVTWVHDFRRAFSLRKYRFERGGDGVVLAEGETQWVFVDAATARPRSIPAEVAAMFDVREAR